MCGLQWLQRNHILLLTADGDLTLASFTTISGRIKRTIDQSTAEVVHLLVDETQIGRFPVQIKEVLAACDYLKHPKLGWVLHYGARNERLATMTTVIAHLSKVHFRRFETFGEAHAFLNMLYESPEVQNDPTPKQANTGRSVHG